MTTGEYEKLKPILSYHPIIPVIINGSKYLLHVEVPDWEPDADLKSRALRAIGDWRKLLTAPEESKRKLAKDGIDGAHLQSTS